MKQRVFIDTDIFLDVALSRSEFVRASKAILALAENSLLIGFTSAVIVSNIYYIIRKSSGDAIARGFIANLLQYVSVVSVEQGDIESAIKSEFKDFEDAIQYYVSKKNHCDVIVTRNVDDFALSKIPVMRPNELLKIYREKL